MDRICEVQTWCGGDGLKLLKFSALKGWDDTGFLNFWGLGISCFTIAGPAYQVVG